MNLHIIHANIIWANIIVSIKSFYREKTVVFFRIAFPVILILVFGTIFMERDNEIFELSIQDLNRTPSSEALVNAIDLTRRFKITQVSFDVDAKQYAKVNNLNLIVIIPENFDISLIEKWRSTTLKHPSPLPSYTTPAPLG